MLHHPHVVARIQRRTGHSCLVIPEGPSALTLRLSKTKSKRLEFDRVLSPDQSPDEVYQATVGPLMDCLRDGSALRSHCVLNLGSQHTDKAQVLFGTGGRPGDGVGPDSLLFRAVHDVWAARRAGDVVEVGFQELGCRAGDSGGGKTVHSKATSSLPVDPGAV